MPIQIDYMDEGRGVLFIGEGIVTGREVIEANKVVYSSIEKMKNYRYGLIDYTDISELDIPTAEIETIVSQNKSVIEFIPEGVLAITARKDIEFGISRMYEMIAELSGVRWEINVFRNREAAVTWLKERVAAKFGIHITVVHS